MAGRKLIYVIAALLAFVGLTAGVPWLSSLIRSDVPPFTLADLRSVKYLPPYDPRPVPSGPVARHHTVYGPSLTMRFKGSSSHLAQFDEEVPPPIAIIEAGATEEVTLPNGRRVRLRALAFFPQPLPTQQRSLLPVEGVYYDPSGRWMSREEGIALREELTGFGGEGMVGNPTANNGVPWTIGIMILTDAPKEDIRAHGLRDTATGGTPSPGGVGAREYVLREPVDGLDRILDYSFTYAAVRPTPMTFHLNVYQGEETVVELEPTAPQSFVWQGKEYVLRNITRGGPPGQPEELFVGEPRKGGGIQFSISGNQHKLVFDALPPALTSVRAFDRAGEEIPSEGFGGSEYAFEGSPEEIDRILIRLKPDYAHVVFKLPEIPVVPEENRKTTKLLDMVIPPTLIQDDWQWSFLIGSILQAQYVNRSVVPSSTPPYPYLVENMTVRELLAMDHARYPPHELVLTRSETHTWIDRKLPGTTLGEQFPILGNLYQLVTDSRTLLLIITGILALFKGLSLFRAASLLRSLKPRGFLTLSLWDAEVLYWELGSKAWNLPPRDELAAIPGLDVDDLQALVTFIRGSNLHRKHET